MTSEFFSHHLQVSPVIAILRGLSVAKTVDAAQRCWDGGIRLVEIPTQSAAALEALTETARCANDTDRLLGAGTICSADDTQRAFDAGARFFVSPGLFPDSVERAQSLGLPYLPGVATPTEVRTALSLSLIVQKLFPVDVMGESAIHTLNGPFPTTKFVAVGGVNRANAQGYLDAGALGVGVGGALSDPETLDFFIRLRHQRSITTSKENSND